MGAEQLRLDSARCEEESALRAESPAGTGASPRACTQEKVRQWRGSGSGSRLWRRAAPAVEAEVGAVRSGCCTVGKERVRSAPGAAAGSEVGRRTAPSGCGRGNLEVAVWGSEAERILGSGQETREEERGAALWESEGPA